MRESTVRSNISRHISLQVGLAVAGILSSHGCGGEDQELATSTQAVVAPPLVYRGGALRFGDAALTQNQYLVSADGHNFLIMQTDCNLVLYNDQAGAVWASNTNGRTSSCRLIVGLVNDLILQDSANFNNDIWRANAAPSSPLGGAALVVQSYVRGFTLEMPGPRTTWASSPAVMSWAQANPQKAFNGSAPGTTVVAFLGFGGFGSPNPNPPAAGCVFDHSRENCCFAALQCRNVWVCGWDYSNLTPIIRQSDWTICGVCFASSC